MDIDAFNTIQSFMLYLFLFLLGAMTFFARLEKRNNRSETNTRPLFFVPSPDQLETNQIATINNSVLYTFQFLRPPVTINELLGWNFSTFAVWMENQTLVVINKYDNETDVTHRECFAMCFRFEDGRQIKMEICGDSVDRIFETALFFAKLQVSETNKIAKITFDCISVSVFDDSHKQQFCLLLDTIPTKKFTILRAHSSMRPVMENVLATRPYLVQLVLLKKSFFDFDAFANSLRERTTSFGSLDFCEYPVKDDDLRSLFDHLNLFKDLHVGCLPNEMLFQLLAAPMKSIGFTVDEEKEGMDLSDAVIAPKDIQVHVPMCDPNQFPTNFMMSFLSRVTQLGHLERIKLDVHHCNAVPEEVERTLLEALVSNQGLKELSLSFGLDAFIEMLLTGLAGHKGLRLLRLDRYPLGDPEYLWVKRLLIINRQLQVTCEIDYNGSFNDEVNKIYALNRFCFGSESLKNKQTSTRASLVSAALTQNATCVQRIGVLLTHHSDLLCELLLERETVFTDGAEDIMMEDDDENSDFPCLIH